MGRERKKERKRERKKERKRTVLHTTDPDYQLCPRVWLPSCPHTSSIRREWELIICLGASSPRCLRSAHARGSVVRPQRAPCNPPAALRHWYILLLLLLFLSSSFALSPFGFFSPSVLPLLFLPFSLLHRFTPPHEYYQVLAHLHLPFLVVCPVIFSFFYLHKTYIHTCQDIHVSFSNFSYF